MTDESITEIAAETIIPSPYQHRRHFDEPALRELAKSIEIDGLIQPITVRPKGDRFELIAGERRWRAIRQFTGLSSIPARVLVVDDLQARRLCATENLQRADLTAIEEVMALAELIDASLLLEFGEDYSGIGNVDEPKWRVRALLMKLDADRAHGTEYFVNKFIDKVKAIFSGLPKTKDWQSFQKNDLPLLFTHDEVQRFALENRLNKSQTKAVAILRESAPTAFREIANSAPAQAATRILAMANPFSVADSAVMNSDESESVADLSADTIKKAARNAILQPALIESLSDPHNHRAQGTGENEWYTPREYIEAAREVLGTIDLDPATSHTANRTVRAERIFTRDDDGLAREWHGHVWMNPPYSQPHIQQFVEKLVEEYRSGRAKQAIALTHNYTDTAWFHHAASHCDAICFTRGRISFVGPNGEKAAPTQGQAFFYFGENPMEFRAKFSGIGLVVTKL